MIDESFFACQRVRVLNFRQLGVRVGFDPVDLFRYKVEKTVSQYSHIKLLVNIILLIADHLLFVCQ